MQNKPQKVVTITEQRPLNFLLVDDDEICLFIHHRVVEMSGVIGAVRTALNGKAALAHLDEAFAGKHEIPDVILLDLMMPEMGGIAFLEALREMPWANDHPIAIALLTSSVKEDWDYVRSLGVKRIISKPLTRESLLMVVEDVLGS